MTSAKQIAANQANARKSTGPRTPNGKTRSAQNALKHGLTATTPVLPDEDPEAFAGLRQEIFEQYKPTTVLVETALVEDLVRVVWRLGRVAPIEAGILQEGHYQERLRAARSGSTSDELAMMINPPTAESLATLQQVQAAKEVFESARAMSVKGFLEDARGTNMLDKLARYETRLESRLFRLMQKLDPLHTRRVEGEIVD